MNATNWHKELRTFSLWYACTFLASMMALFIAVWLFADGQGQDVRQLLQVFPAVLRQVEFYIFPLIIYFFFLLVRSLVKNYKRHRWTGLLKGVAFKVVLPLGLAWTSLQFIDAYRFSEQFDYTWDTSAENQLPHSQDLYMKDGKQRGMHIFNFDADSTGLADLNTHNIEWLTYVPYISQDIYNKPPSWISLDTNRVRLRHEQMKKSHDAMAAFKFKTMLKPHIWLQQTPNGTWRSDIAMTTEADWVAWFDYYSTSMLMYAEIAEDLGMDMLCIGTELHNTVVEQPAQWISLISNIKEVYSGKLVYAANWSDDLDAIPFWDQMDYIGIQAYFPIAERDNPDLEELEAGWIRHAKTLEQISTQYNKPILFTEIGYKSTADAATEPWLWNRAAFRFYKQVSFKTQALSYQAFFNVIWSQPWFAGAHVWHWSGRNDSGFNNRFTLRGKPALNVIAKGFGAHQSRPLDEAP